MTSKKEKPPFSTLQSINFFPVITCVRLTSTVNTYTGCMCTHTQSPLHTDTRTHTHKRARVHVRTHTNTGQIHLCRNLSHQIPLVGVLKADRLVIKLDLAKYSALVSYHLGDHASVNAVQGRNLIFLQPLRQGLDRVPMTWLWAVVLNNQPWHLWQEINHHRQCNYAKMSTCVQFLLLLELSVDISLDWDKRLIWNK